MQLEKDKVAANKKSILLNVWLHFAGNIFLHGLSSVVQMSLALIKDRDDVI
jgi:hypothetical protein